MTGPAHDRADTLFQPIADKLRVLLGAESVLDQLNALVRGEPEILPVRYYPFAVVFVQRRREAQGERGYGISTGMVDYVYAFYVAIEVLLKDTSGLVPDEKRWIDVPSYDLAHELGSAALAAVQEWGGEMGDLSDDPLYNLARTEKTSEIRLGDVSMGLANRNDNVSNRATFEGAIYSQKLTELGMTWE